MHGSVEDKTRDNTGPIQDRQNETSTRVAGNRLRLRCGPIFGSDTGPGFGRRLSNGGCGILRGRQLRQPAPRRSPRGLLGGLRVRAAPGRQRNYPLSAQIRDSLSRPMDQIWPSCAAARQCRRKKPRDSGKDRGFPA
jgi:hypothetical protein